MVLNLANAKLRSNHFEQRVDQELGNHYAYS